MNAKTNERIKVARKIIKQSEFSDQAQMQRWRSAVDRNHDSLLIQQGSIHELKAVAKAFVILEPKLGLKYDLIICSIIPEKH